MARYSNCPCEGKWTAKLARWVVLERLPNNHGILKCLECGWKWKSKRRYVAKLPDWKERSRRGLTDAEILQRLRDGNLRIDPETAVVESGLRGWRVLSQYEDQHDSGYRFVKINWKNKQKKIAVHRLQWMAYSEELIPEGYDVHHKTSPPRPKPKPNNLSNLELRDSYENQSDNGCGTCDDDLPF